MVAKFLIRGIFYITNIGFVIAGDILEGALITVTKNSPEILKEKSLK
jgi:hypothetical protein